MFDISGLLLPSIGPVDKSTLPNCSFLPTSAEDGSFLPITAEDFDREFTQEMRNMVAEGPAALDLLADTDDLMSGLLDEVSQSLAPTALASDVTHFHLLQTPYELNSSIASGSHYRRQHHFPPAVSCSKSAHPQQGIVGKSTTQDGAHMLFTRVLPKSETRTASETQGRVFDGKGPEESPLSPKPERSSDPSRKHDKSKDALKGNKQNSEKTLRKQLQEFVHKSNQFAPEADLRFAIDNMVRAWKEVQAYGINPQEVLSQLPGVSPEAHVGGRESIPSVCTTPSYEVPPSETASCASTPTQCQPHQNNHQQQHHRLSTLGLPRHHSDPHLNWQGGSSASPKQTCLRSLDIQRSFSLQDSLVHGDDVVAYHVCKTMAVDPNFVAGDASNPELKHHDEVSWQSSIPLPLPNFPLGSTSPQHIPYLEGIASACQSAAAGLPPLHTLEQTQPSHQGPGPSTIHGMSSTREPAFDTRRLSPASKMRRFSFTDSSCSGYPVYDPGLSHAESPCLPGSCTQIAGSLVHCITPKLSRLPSQQDYWQTPRPEVVQDGLQCTSATSTQHTSQHDAIHEVDCADWHEMQKQSPTSSDAFTDDGHDEAQQEGDDESIDHTRSHLVPKRDIDIEQLQKVYDFPINEAAKRLGVGVTVLKKYCRKYNIPRWPYRKLKSMDKLIESVIDYSSQDPQTSEAVLKELRTFRALIYNQPSIDLESRIKKLRQANFKLEYKQRLAKSPLEV